VPTNFYFQSGDTSGTTAEQRLVEDLIIESLKIYGHDLYYLPRTSVKQDNVLGEDVLSQFTNAYPIEMYLQNVQGWDQQQELFTKFGIEVKDTATFVVAKRRWEESVAYQAPTLQLPSRPAEGDLLYFPKTDAMFEIKFVEHLNPFYQIGKFYVYTLQCELYRYSSEVIETGLEEIDDDFKTTTADIYEYSVLSQTGDLILDQTGSSIISAAYDSRANEKTSNNTQFEEEAKDILDFSVLNPFGEI
jgi:hypothetical protein